MKKISYCLLAMVLFTTGVSAQVTIGSGKVPEKFSVLELISNNTLGLRLPQMTNDQRKEMEEKPEFEAAKTGAAMGLQIFNTDTKCVETWNGTTWISACAMCGDVPCQYIQCAGLGGVLVPQFMAYNLGADPSLNTPKKQMNYLATHPFSDIDGHVYGGRYQWGRANLPYAISTDGNYTLYKYNTNSIALSSTGRTYDSNGQLIGQDNNHVFLDFSIGSTSDWRMGEITPVQQDNLWGNGLHIGTATDGGIPFNGKTYQRPVKTVNDPCPDGWRVPTQDEWERLGNYDCNPTTANTSTHISIPTSSSSSGVGTSSTGFTWVPVVCASGSCSRNHSWYPNSTQSGYAIYKTDVWNDASFDKANLIDANDPEPFLFLPAAGSRALNYGGLSNVGSYGYYWSSSVYSTRACGLSFGSISVFPDHGEPRAYGYSVRCVKH